MRGGDDAVGAMHNLAIQILPSLKFLKDYNLEDKTITKNLQHFERSISNVVKNYHQNDYRNHHPASIISIVQVPVNGVN